MQRRLSALCRRAGSRGAAAGGGFVEEFRRRRLIEIADAQHFPPMPTR